MKRIFQLYNSVCIKYKNQNQLIDKLLSYFTDKPLIEDSCDDFLFDQIKKEIDKDPIYLVQLIGFVHQKKKESNKFSKTDERKHFGIYYTDYEIAKRLVRDGLSLVKWGKNELSQKTFYEPCVGIGIFVIAYIDYIMQLAKIMNKPELQKIINQIYCSDIDKEAIGLLRKIIPNYVKFKYKIDITLPSKNYYVGDVLFKKTKYGLEKNSPREIFNIKNGFDIVITNPPYKLLKANSNKYSGEDTLDTKKLVLEIKKNNFYKYNEGTLNYYKIFVEEIIENYTHHGSVVGLLIPNTLLNDLQSEKLRKLIFNNFKTSTLNIIPEKNDFFPDITQSFCFFNINKNSSSELITINTNVKSKSDFNKNLIVLQKEFIKNISSTMPIITENEIGWSILRKINEFNRIKDFTDLLNLRGELDLTLGKGYITKQKTDYRLIKGCDIKEYNFNRSDLFVNHEFINMLNGKRKHIEVERLVCQQISNMHSRKRLKFTKVPEKFILANSCNYICKNASLFSDKNITLKYLLGILNSYIIDWRFKVTNSNNHISNYEISELPIPIPNRSQRKAIEELVDLTERENNITNSMKLNSAIFKLYKLDKAEINYIAKKYNNFNTEINIRMELKNAI